MSQRPSKTARREAAKRIARHRQFGLRGAVATIAVVAIGSFIHISGGSGDQAVALAPDFKLETLAGESVSLMLMDRSGAISASYHITSTPTTYFVAPDGTIADPTAGVVSRQWLESNIRE